MQSLEVLDFAPERVVDPLRRRGWWARLGTALGDGALALLLNGAVVAFLADVGWPLRETQMPAAVSVELVDHIPGQNKQGPDGKAGEPSRSGEASGSRQAAADPGNALHADAASPEPAEKRSAPAAAEPSKPAEPAEARQPEPGIRPVDAAKAETAAASQVEPPQPDKAPAEADTATTATGTSPPPAVATAPAGPPTPAVPPPPEHPNGTAAPQLVEAPKPPAPTPGAGTAASPAPEPVLPEEPPAAPPPAQPAVLSSRDASDAVAPAAPAPEAPPVPTAEEKRQAEATAKLAAVLPFSQGSMGDPFAGRMASQGQTASQNYRGAVYGNFSKANDLVEAARAKGMKGQAVVAFSVDAAGNLASLAVAVSSGNPELDATALELIRRAAPFPPPPPGAQRSFSPAIGFGLD